jgi:hypothetical protein
MVSRSEVRSQAVGRPNDAGARLTARAFGPRKRWTQRSGAGWARNRVWLAVVLAACIPFGGAAVARAQSSSLGSLASTMAPGSFATLQTSNITNTMQATGASGLITGYADKGVWDPTTRQLFFIGGDHGGGSRVVSYRESTNAWQILPLPSWIPPPTATPMHGYHHSAITPGGFVYHRPYNNMVAQRLNIASGSWSAVPALGTNVMGYNSCCVGVAYFPERQSLVYASIEAGTNGAVVEFSEQTGQWNRIAGGLPMGAYQNFAEYNPIQKVVLFGGGNDPGSRKMYKLTSSGQVTALRDAPISLGVMQAIVTVDPVSGDYLFFNNSRQFYTYNVATDTWRLQSIALPIFTNAFGIPVFGTIASPISTYGINMFVTCDEGPSCWVTLYKHAAGGGTATPPPVVDTKAPSGITGLNVSGGTGGGSPTPPPPSDTTPPTVSISSPAGGTVSGSVTVTASASDNVGVVGVQFKLDGANLGSELTSAPYSMSWDTASTANGGHTLTAVARDAAGNQKTATNVSLQVSNAAPTPPPGAADFQTRCSAAGVVRCFGFDSVSEIAPYIYSGATTPTVDTTVKASGGGAMKMTIPSNSPADTSGGFGMNFSPGSLNSSNTDPYPVQFGAGEEFYVQWRQRFSPEFLTTVYTGGGGWKQAIIGEGDRTGTPLYSCTQLEVPVQNTSQRGIPQMYHSCGVKDGHYDPLDVVVGSTINLQYAAGLDCRYPGPYNEPGCVRYKPNQWMTFQVRIKVGTWYSNNGVYRKDSTIQMWVAEEGQASKLVMDRDPAKGTGYDLVNLTPSVSKYGKVWLLPYHTGKDPSQVHPTAYTWYDELVISRQRIADPK